MKEAEAEQIFKQKTNDIKKLMKKKGVTFMGELNTTGKKLFGIKFRGVFSSDKIPILNELVPYAILNLDKSDEPGSHWIAVAKTSDDNLMCFDSFGRRNTQIIPSLKKSGNGKIIDTDYDANQKVKETDCGMRCLGWLYMFNHYGEEVANKI
tara:strand:- start:1216 stop:1671 length:456 start_codon:yes stop_codon:yes gene_type:complete